MNWLLLGGFLILFAENRFKPRIYFTHKRDTVIWYTYKGKRKFWKL